MLAHFPHFWRSLSGGTLFVATQESALQGALPFLSPFTGFMDEFFLWQDSRPSLRSCENLRRGDEPSPSHANFRRSGTNSIWGQNGVDIFFGHGGSRGRFANGLCLSATPGFFFL